MIPNHVAQAYRRNALRCLEKAGITLTCEEKKQVEVADFGISRMDEIGLAAITYVNTSRCCAKELILTPWQICPEHRHPATDHDGGKEETFRCRRGLVYLYVEGEPALPPADIQARIPEDLLPYFTVFREIVLHPGEQYTLKENMLHWFQAGEEGCIVSEFSTHSTDEQDIFTIPYIKRVAEVCE